MLAILPLSHLFMIACTLSGGAGPAPGATGHYRVLPGEPSAAPPFNVVEIVYAPQQVDGAGVAWQLTVREKDEPGAPPLFHLRATSGRDPFDGSAEPIQFTRYQLALPETREFFDYRDVHTGGPLLPRWGEFERYFIPHPAAGTRRLKSFPCTCEYLGHVLTLERVDDVADWAPWDNVVTLQLDPELLIGNSRSVRDREGHRLPQEPERQTYHYIPLSGEDYRTSIEAGMNLFGVSPEQEQYVRGKPVFYLRTAGGEPPLRYPADLYRSNYVGNQMYMDEPTCHMVGDKRVHNTLRYFTDASTLITKRVRSKYSGIQGQAFGLERELTARGISLGDMRLANLDFPSWETVFETAHYQLAGGLAGIVHEGRYRLDEFNAYVKASTGLERDYTAEEMLRYVYAFLRGAARHFHKDWGMSIYGQCDPKLSPGALALAYDMGARYLWYWTSDHEHHMPWPEQIELTRSIRKHIATHRRPSIRGPLPVLDKVIVIPSGYFLTLESGTARKVASDLWWVRELDPAGQNQSSLRYHRLMRHAFIEISKALDAAEDFDICVDDGGRIEGYRKTVRVGSD